LVAECFLKIKIILENCENDFGIFGQIEIIIKDLDKDFLFFLTVSVETSC